MNLTPLILLLLAGLLVYLALGDSGERMVRRRAESWWSANKVYFTRAVVVPTIVFLGLGLLMRDWLLTPFLFVGALWLGYMRVGDVRRELDTISVRQVSQLVLAFRGAYQIQPAVFKCLELSSGRVSGALQEAVNVSVEIFYATSSSERAFHEFRQRVDNPFLSQFLYILEVSESAANTSVTGALDDLVERLRQQEDLERQVQTGLSSITGQTSFIQVLAILVAFVMALVPGFRAVYVRNVMWRLLYMILVGVMLGASYYIERRTRELKEQML